jgi:hypothetical protein
MEPHAVPFFFMFRSSKEPHKGHIPFRAQPSTPAWLAAGWRGSGQGKGVGERDVFHGLPSFQALRKASRFSFAQASGSRISGRG